jgi:signal transduction histidine kinase
MRPLDFLTSIKKKLGVVIVTAVAVTVAVVSLGQHAGLSPVVTGIAAACLALAFVQFLAHGMTRPLREMVAAARAMARGDYGRRVTETSRDEVGELARAFNTMAAELAEVDRIRRDLVANVSHDLRTPIGALRAVLENLVDGVEPVERGTLEATLRQVERLGSLVEQLLDLSKLESGAVPLRRERVPVRSVVDEVVREWRMHGYERRVELGVTIDPPSLTLDADPARIHQVLANLVANAVRHSPDGGCVNLVAREHRRGVVLEVTDEGPGIAPDEAERVFERFYRSDQARSDGGGGGRATNEISASPSRRSRAPASSTPSNERWARSRFLVVTARLMSSGNDTSDPPASSKGRRRRSTTRPRTSVHSIERTPQPVAGLSSR